MQILKQPFLKLRLTPHFDSSNNATGISISLTIEAPDIPAGSTLYLFTTRMGNLPNFQHKPGNIKAFDSTGPLAISFRTSPLLHTQQEWYFNRSTRGHVTLEFDVSPRVVDVHTPMGPRDDLRYDQGGLQGGGRWFLPRPDSDLIYRNIVEWDLSKSPAGTRGVWSFGEGPAAVEREGSGRVLLNTVYMTGPVQSYPESQSADGADYSTMYWFGRLPPNIDRLKEFNIRLFPNMTSFFGDPAGPDNTYRTFVRKVIRGWGGTGYLASFAMEYDEDSRTEVSEGSMALLLTHEMIHSWAVIDDEGDEDPTENAWYYEGAARYYSAVLPFKFKQRGADYSREFLSSFFTVYFTSPSLNISDEEARRDFWEDWYAQDMIYARGMVYLFKIDSMLAKAAKEMRSKTIRPLENIMAELAVRRLKGEKLCTGDWLELLYPWVGKERADKDFADMTAGKTIDLSDTEVLGGIGKLVKTHQEVQEVGIDRSSINSRVITGLKTGSRAEIAGLREGDKIIWVSKFAVCQEDFEKNMRFVIERDGEQFRVEYWPRSFELVPVWQVVSEV